MNQYPPPNNQQPLPQPGQYQPTPHSQPGARRNFWQWYKSKGRFAKIGIGCGSLVIALMLCVCSLAAYSSMLTPQKMARPTPTTNKTINQIATTATTPTLLPVSPTATPTNTSTPTPQSIHYPPTTEADLRGLAAKGVVSAIHEFHSESVGAVGICPQPKREVTV